MANPNVDCDHPRTVNIAFGIFKCSSCGEIWDEGSDEDKRRRAESQPNAIKREARKQAIIRNQRKRRYGR